MSSYSYRFSTRYLRVFFWTSLVTVSCLSHRVVAQGYTQSELENDVREAVAFLLDLEGQVTGSETGDSIVPGVWGRVRP